MVQVPNAGHGRERVGDAGLMPWNSLTITGAKKAREAHARWKATPEGRKKRLASDAAYRERNRAAIRERDAKRKRELRARQREERAQQTGESE